MDLKEIFLGKDGFTHKQFWAWIAALIILGVVFNWIF